MLDDPDQRTPIRPPSQNLEEIEVAFARLLHVRASGKLGIIVALVCLLWISALVFLFR
ncbi:hypothetical protein [Mesorhizobium sp. M2A.F.Ca.ET.042.01.1.1]|uniref:hypothetical protein n=1 Tax=Mesorhizobium sp. M2A.F.Ca.ET.042.01.1.1 TaxID=2496745 RepID=UPI001675331C|nr:hypothetical protein [Mesorhizobium sp. M2A.F.Ca.ET.042.01.1.1]